MPGLMASLVSPLNSGQTVQSMGQSAKFEDVTLGHSINFLPGERPTSPSVKASDNLTSFVIASLLPGTIKHVPFAGLNK